ncbi:MAG: hypothetical protein L0H63_13320 [Nitrococcus sp.]|nr:hypothetical protein [Nitrococcus sp.]
MAPTQFPWVGFQLRKTVPRAAASTVPAQVTGLLKCLQVVFDRVAVCARGLFGLGHSDAPALAAKFQIACHAPLNSSISAISLRIAGVIAIVSVRMPHHSCLFDQARKRKLRWLLPGYSAIL